MISKNSNFVNINHTICIRTCFEIRKLTQYSAVYDRFVKCKLDNEWKNYPLGWFEINLISLNLQDDFIHFTKNICEVSNLNFSLFQIVFYDWINIVEKFNDGAKYHSEFESSSPPKILPAR